MINIKINKSLLSEIIYTDRTAIENLNDKEINNLIKQKINMLQTIYDEWDQIETYSDFNKLFKKIDIYEIGDLINLLNSLNFYSTNNKENTYKNTFNKAKRINLDIHKLKIADEMTFALNGKYIKTSDDEYEMACEIVNKAYLKYDIELNKLTDSITDLLYKEIPINEIDRYMIIDNIKW